MRICFIRHGEPDYAPCTARGFIGQGRDLATLTEAGARQAEAAARDARLRGCELIVSSPYTRALQTAAIISRLTTLKLRVEIDLHEWIPDKTFRLASGAQASALYDDFAQCGGEYPAGKARAWETASAIIARTRPVFDSLLASGARAIVVVTHGGVIRRYTGQTKIAYCKISEIEYSNDFKCCDHI